MRTLKDILKLLKTGLALYGGYCLVTGVASKKIKENWGHIIAETESRVYEFLTGEPMEKTIETDYKVEDA